MIFTHLLPFSLFLGTLSSLLLLLQNRLPFLKRELERTFPRFLILTFFLSSLLVGRSFATNDVIWDEARFEKIAARAITPTALSFQNDFLAEVHHLADQNPSNLKEDVAGFLQQFHTVTYQHHEGKDEKLRPIYVSAQGDFERAMAMMFHDKRIAHLIGIIHTPTPATPLCTEGEISSQLVDPTFEGDQRRLYTVMKRPEIIREFLTQGGVMIAAYPEQGRLKRSDEQLAIFDGLKEKYPEGLIDLPLNCDAMQKDMIGATYLFQTDEDDWFAFGIMATQANAPQDGRMWGMWFGSVHDPIIFRRVQSVFGYLHQTQEQDLSAHLFGTNH